jgi:four helix bundle protein
MFNFEKLIVYQESLNFSHKIYKITADWPKNEMFGLTNQIRRASVSIALNIAEGSSRTKKDFAHFLDLSRGSCYEVVAILAIAHKNSYINEKQYKNLYDNCSYLSRMISALKKSLHE